MPCSVQVPFDVTTAILLQGVIVLLGNGKVSSDYRFPRHVKYSIFGSYEIWKIGKKWPYNPVSRASKNEDSSLERGYTTIHFNI